MNQEPLVSVVMASYNCAGYLPVAVASVLNQTHRNVELLVIDDGSTDDTRSVVQQFMDDARVRHHWQPNAGQCAAKNKGIELSNGEFVAFLDADDCWKEDKLARQLELFVDRPDVGVGYGFLELIDHTGRQLPWEPVPPRRGEVTEELLLENFVPFSSAIVRRTLLERHGGFDAKLDMGIDYDLWLRLSLQCEFDFVPDVVGQYRIWPGQMSRKVHERYEAGIRIMRKFLSASCGAVPRDAVARAWAHTYVGRGNAKLWSGGDWRGAWGDYFRALHDDPRYWQVYRAMLRSLLVQRPPRQGP